MTDLLEQTPPEPPEPPTAPVGELVDAPDERAPGWVERLGRRLAAVTIEGWITFGIVVGAVVFTLAQLHPDLLFSNSTPTGGDMGAHVWAPAYLRDHLLPHFRLSGWAPDWYAGFPAYQFYMVIPALAVVILDVVLPYGLALKLVSIAGVLTLPIAAWAFGKLSGLRFPAPPMFAAIAVVFLFDETFTIYGGNIASTMAGEFSFSIALSISLVYFGVLARGLRTGRHRALAAGLLALCVPVRTSSWRSSRPPARSCGSCCTSTGTASSGSPRRSRSRCCSPRSGSCRSGCGVTTSPTWGTSDAPTTSTCCSRARGSGTQSSSCSA